MKSLESGQKILIFSSDSKYCELLRKELLQSGFLALGFCAGKEGFLVLFLRFDPDLVIIDIQDKEEVVTKMKLVKILKRNQNIPVLFLIPPSDLEIRDQLIQAGFNRLLLKTVPLLQVMIDIELLLLEKKGNEGNEMGGAQNSPVEYDRIFIKNNAQYISIDPGDICFIKAARSQSLIFLPEKRFVISTNLSDLLSQIDYDHLIKCHRSYAVNLYCIASFDHHNIYTYFQNQKKEIPIGENYRKIIWDKLKIIKSK